MRLRPECYVSFKNDNKTVDAGVKSDKANRMMRPSYFLQYAICFNML